MHIVLRRPGIYLHEIARELYDNLGVDVPCQPYACF